MLREIKHRVVFKTTKTYNTIIRFKLKSRLLKKEQ